MSRELRFAVVAALAVAACSGGESSGPGQSAPPAIARVMVSPDSTVVEAGKTVQLIAASRTRPGIRFLIVPSTGFPMTRVSRR